MSFKTGKLQICGAWGSGKHVLVPMEPMAPACYSRTNRHCTHLDMSRDLYSELLTAYEQHLGPGASALDLPRTEALVINGRAVSFSFVPNEGSSEDGMVIGRTDVARFTQSPSQDLCRLLLQANNLWAGTAGSTLGLRGHDTLMMSTARRIGSLDAATLDAMLNTLCADAGNWAGRLTAKPKSEPPPDLQHMLHMRA